MNTMEGLATCRAEPQKLISASTAHAQECSLEHMSGSQCQTWLTPAAMVQGRTAGRCCCTPRMVMSTADSEGLGCIEALCTGWM